MTWWQGILAAGTGDFFAVIGVLIGVWANRRKIAAEIAKLGADATKVPLEAEKIRVDIEKTLQEAEKLRLETQKLRHEIGTVITAVDTANSGHSEKLEQIHAAVEEAVRDVRELDSAVKKRMHWQIEPEMLRVLTALVQRSGHALNGRLKHAEMIETISSVENTEPAERIVEALMNEGYMRSSPDSRYEVTTKG
ncbi:hypothetical protein ACFSTC_30805 [Nonomuraea ferruginea]